MNWQHLSASVIGVAHLRNQLPCQDAHSLRVLDNQWLLCAVADGLGSAALADRGAQLAVRVALDTLEAITLQNELRDETDGRVAIHQAFAATRTALEEQAVQENQELRSYATTLIVALVSDSWLAVGHLGDGAVVAQFTGEALTTCSPPQRGEFANETMPLTALNALESVRYHSQAGFLQSLALFSDGLQNLCLDSATHAPHEPFFAPLFLQLATPLQAEEARQALEAFLQSERVCKRTDDDKTLLLAQRCEETGMGQSE